MHRPMSPEQCAEFDDKISKLSTATRANILAALDSILTDPMPSTTYYPKQEDIVTESTERDAGALRDADDIIAKLAAAGHGDYSKYRNEIADLWDGEYGLWQGNDDCTTDLGDPELRDLKLIQEDHYDQHMDDDEDKPEWDDMIWSGGDYLFFA